MSRIQAIYQERSTIPGFEVGELVEELLAAGLGPGEREELLALLLEVEGQVTVNIELMVAANPGLEIQVEERLEATRERFEALAARIRAGS